MAKAVGKSHQAGEKGNLASESGDLCLVAIRFLREEADKYMDSKKREESVITSIADFDRVIKTGHAFLSTYATLVKRAEEKDTDEERAALIKRAVKALEGNSDATESPEFDLPIIGENGDPNSNN